MALRLAFIGEKPMLPSFPTICETAPLPNAAVTLVGAQSEALPYANLACILTFIELRGICKSGEIRMRNLNQPSDRILQPEVTAE